MTLTKHIRSCVAAAIAVTAFVTTANATTIFDGFGSGGSFEAPRFVSVANDPLNTGPNPTATDVDWAFGFTADQDYTLDGLEIALSHVTSRGASEGEIILRDNVGGEPGAELERWSISGISNLGSVQSFTSVTNVLLAGGSQYWIELSAGTEGSLTMAGMGFHTSTGDFSSLARQFDEGAWTGSGIAQAAFRVTGTIAPPPVPLPAGAVLLPAGLVLMGCMRRRRKADQS